ncbi:MAG: hypothetical protein M1828_007096 [Chrysothrix sp. TS-e1954]|nr:MAG: hypothetical protein M1828_007096 [Chrysothrix sp. TS-e1954]
MADNPTSQDLKQKEEQVKKGLFQQAKAWGDSSLPQAALATLIFPQHFRPLHPLPMLFPPVLLLSSYLNLNGYVTDAAGISAAWSGLYALLASRRRYAVMKKFGTRGLLRGATFGLAAANMLGGGISYAFGKSGRAESWIGKGKEDSE